MNNIINWIKDVYLNITAWSIIIGIPLGVIIIALVICFERKRHKQIGRMCKNDKINEL